MIAYLNKILEAKHNENAEPFGTKYNNPFTASKVLKIDTYLMQMLLIQPLLLAAVGWTLVFQNFK